MLSKIKSTHMSPLNSLPWKVQDENPCSENTMDMEWLSCQPMLPFLVPMISPHLLYRSLMSHGLEDSVDVVQWIRGKQLQKVLDYDIWENADELETQDVSIRQILSWIRIWLDISPEFAAERFFELEEETMVLVLSKLFEIMPVGINNTIDDMCTEWQQTPDKRFFIKSQFQELDDEFFLLRSFVASLYAVDVNYAGSAFSYASMLVRQESLESGLKWRAGRLADQGFISKEEALKILAPKKWGDLKKLGLCVKAHAGLDQDEEMESIVHLLSEMTPEDGIHYMRLALSHENLKQIAGNSDTDPEHFYQDEDFLLTAAEQISEKAKFLIIKAQSVAMIKGNNRENSSEKKLLIENVLFQIAQNDMEKSASLKSRLSRLSNIIASASDSCSFDNETIGRALAVTRGLLNIGLEICFALPSELGLQCDQSKNQIENGLTFLDQLGPEYLFQLGWNCLLNLKNQIPKETNSQLEQKQNYPSAELEVTLTALKNFIPMYPKTLDIKSEKMPTYVTQEVRPFESIADVESAKLFLKNLEI